MRSCSKAVLCDSLEYAIFHLGAHHMNAKQKHHQAILSDWSEIFKAPASSGLTEYYGSNVPLFRRNGYRQSGARIP